MGRWGDEGDEGDERDKRDKGDKNNQCPMPNALFPITHSLFAKNAIIQPCGCFLDGEKQVGERIDGDNNISEISPR
jgi:hypothetical protein